MKKIMMTLAAVCVAATMNAQGYVGGSLGYSTTKTNNGSVGTPATEEYTTKAFVIQPEIGYKMDDKMSVGLVISYVTASKEAEYVGPGTAPSYTKPSSTTIGLRPYLRYQVLTFGKANIFVDGGLNFAISKEKEVGLDANGKAYDNKPAMDLGLFVQPGIAFDINEKWSIVAKLEDMFTFGYSKNAVPDLDGAPDASSNLNFGLSTGGFQLGSLRFGVYYNF